MTLLDDSDFEELEARFGPIGARLRAPTDILSLGEFVSALRMAEVTIRVEELASLVSDPALPGRIRGAFGEVLMEGASENALQGAPCDFDPPSAFEVLFRKQGRMTPGTDFPSPWLLGLDPYRGDLIVRLTLFGMATDWAPAAAEALASALRRVDWSGGDGRFVPRWRIVARRYGQRTLPELITDDTSLITSFVLETLSPVVLSNGGAHERPASLFSTLSQRVEGLARWQEASVETDWREIAGRLHQLDWQWSDTERIEWTRGSRRQDRSLRMQGLTGRLTISGSPEELATLEPVFRLAGQIHIGADVAFGCGRVVVRAA